MSEQLFQRKRRRRLWRRVLQVFLGLLAAAAVGGVVWLIWFSNVLVAAKVDVEGVTTLRPADVLTAADVPIGLQLARLDTVSIETRVAAMERVDRVDVRRHWPNTVVVDVTERKPIAWVLADGRIRYVDRNGVDFRTVQRKPDNLIELRIGTTDPLVRQPALEAATAVISFLRQEGRDILVQTRYVSADTQDSVRLRLSDNRTVVWGSREHDAEKLQVLRPLLKRVDAERYDVSAPELPTTTSAQKD